MRIKTIIKIKKTITIIEIIFENNENHEKHRIPCENHEIKENPRILCENHDNHENHRISREIHKNSENNTTQCENYENHKNLRISSRSF